MKCDRKTFAGLGELFGELGFILQNSIRLLRMMLGSEISPAFRERIMLAATSVYGCSYCSWVHAKLALMSGVEEECVKAMGLGIGDVYPKEEAVALVYAQHWAESNGLPEREAVQKLRDTYGYVTSESVHVVLRSVRFGNFCGNGFNNLVCKATLGKVGGHN